MVKKILFILIILISTSCDNDFDSFSINERLNRNVEDILSISPFADTYISSKNPNTNYEQAQKILILDKGNDKKYGYIKFKVPEITKKINKVYLKVYVGNDTDKAPKIYTSGPWVKKKITWNKKPKLNDLIYSSSSSISVGWQEFDITGFLSEGTNRFAIIPQSSDGLALASSEHLKKPELVIEMGDEINTDGDHVFKFEIKTDSYGSDNSWKLFNDKGVVVDKGPDKPYGNNKLYSINIPVSDGNYRLEVYDTGNDGLKDDAYIKCYLNNMEFLKAKSWFDDPNKPYEKLWFKDIATIKFRVGSDNTPLTDREQQYLDEHNKQRKIAHEEVGLKYIPLRWNHELARRSYIWAKYVAKNKGCKLEHEQNIPEGENLAARHGSAAPRPIDGVVQSWVNSPGHYYQLKWRGSHYVGCAEAYGDNCSVQACRFIAPGNCNGYDNWIEDYTACGVTCPPEGCYVE